MEEEDGSPRKQLNPFRKKPPPPHQWYQNLRRICNCREPKKGQKYPALYDANSTNIKQHLNFYLKCYLSRSVHRLSTSAIFSLKDNMKLKIMESVLMTTKPYCSKDRIFN